MRAALCSIHRFREALSQIGSAISASAEYTRLSACRDDLGTDGSAHDPALHLPI